MPSLQQQCNEVILNFVKLCSEVEQSFTLLHASLHAHAAFSLLVIYCESQEALFFVLLLLLTI